MNHKSLISVLTLSTMLTACGGGGGGSGHVPTTTLPNNPSVSNQQLTQMKTSVSNESERVVYVADAYGIPANARPFSISLFSSSSSCLEKNCVDAAFDNMKNLLIDETTENLVETDDLRQALKLAGYADAETADLTTIKSWVDANRQDINEIYAKYGQEKIVTIENAKLNMVETDGVQDTFINFKIDENQKISAVEVNTDSTSLANSLQYKLERQGDKDEFKATVTVYKYGINTPNYSGTMIESLEPLDLATIKEKLKARVDELAATGAYDNGGAGYVDTVKDAIDGATEFPTGDVEAVGPGQFPVFSNHAEETNILKYSSYAKEMKLAYSDFGLIDVSTQRGNESWSEKTAFAGGYEAKRIDPTKMNGQMSFEGKAVGGVDYGNQLNHSDNGDMTTKSLALSGNATLDFDNGKQTLAAQFSNWYDVTVEKDNGQNSISFTNGDKIADADFKFRGQDTYNVDDFVGNKQVLADGIDPNAPLTGIVGNGYGAAEFGYYGDAGKPSEATGYVAYGESLPYQSDGSLDYDRIRSLDVQFGFGAVKKAVNPRV